MVLEKAREIFNELTEYEKSFVIEYFREHDKPSRWKYSRDISSCKNKWLLSKGFSHFEKLSTEELDELEKEIKKEEDT